MKLKLTDAQILILKNAGLFACITILIVLLYPAEESFKYQFEVGKPWSYELMTASFDFPIYKSDQQIAREKEEALKDFAPYYKLDTTVVEKQIKKMTADLQGKGENTVSIPASIKVRLKSIYSKGVISANDNNKLQTDKRK